MKKALHFLVDYWYIPVLILGLVLAWIVFRGKRWPIVDTIMHEFAAIRAGAKARDDEARLGHEKAKANVKSERAAEIGKLNEDQRKKAKELEDDPVALARFLVRAGSRDDPERSNG